jgi:hypothetical protein
MTKVIKQIRILVACPNDVENIKKMIEQCCDNFNPELLKNEKIEFEVIHWKKNVNSILTGEGLQDIINREYDEQEYDVFIGIFWKRFGEKQGNGKTPTEEEFERALKGYKQTRIPKIVKIYFKQDQMLLPKSKEEILQIVEILDFKDRIKNEGIYKEFNEEYLLDCFYRELLNFLYQFKEPSKIGPRDKIITYELTEYHIERNLVRAEDYHRYNSFLDSTAKIKSLELLKRENRIIILGDAGIGKTEEIDFISHHFSTHNEGLLPIKNKLKNYVDQDIEKYITEPYQKLSEENILLLFDGFDEVESKNKMTFVRKILFYLYQHPTVRIVITSRKNIYNNEFADFKVYYLTNLDSEDIDKFITEG